MPYITQEDRDKLKPLTDELDKLPFSRQMPHQTSGWVNYLITKLMRRVVGWYGESYGVYSMLIGALECAKLELYRRQVTLYEDKAIERNGDV
jgi:hypothetical protein